MRRVILAVMAAVVLLGAAPAWAHEEINPKTLSTGTPTFFILSAANEKKVDLVKVVLTAPSGVPLGEAVQSPAGWTASKTDTAVTWTGGAVRPEQFAQWGFETDGADQPGQFTFTVTLGFADNSSEPVKVPVTVTAPGSSGTPAVTPTTGQATVTTTGATSTSTETAAPASTDTSDNSSGKSTAALVLGAVGVVLGIAALVIALRRRPAPATGKTADW